MKLLALISVVVISIAGCGGANDVIDPELEYLLESLPFGEKIPVIVTLSDRIDLEKSVNVNDRQSRMKWVRAIKKNADEGQAEIRRLLNGMGVGHVTSLWVINGLAFEADAGVIEELQTMPGVENIRLDALLSVPPSQPAVSSPAEQNLNSISAPSLWDMGITGQGTVVANMDTGVDVQHADLSARWRGGSNSWFDPYNQHNVPYDPIGHGTQAMGIIVGGDLGGSAIGVAPGAQWIAVKIFNDSGVASLSAIHQGFQWLLDPDGDLETDDMPDVVNSSWGMRNNAGECITEFQDDVATLKAVGISVVFSAGNEGPADSTSLSPANYADSFSVGAIDSSLNIAGFSSRGPSACSGMKYPDVVAPGVNIRTADLTLGGVFPDSYTYVTGTSFASAHVAGAMALIKSAFPQMTADQVEAAFRASALDLGDIGPDNDYGYGLIDALAAYELILNPVECTDIDTDGYFVESDCGGEPDCDDTEYDVHPGAREIKHDGIDQDCNGYDLTIDVTQAKYYLQSNSLEVRAKSDLSSDAALELAGFGPMSWNSETLEWEAWITGLEGFVSRITILGREGRSTVQMRMSRSQTK